MADRDRPVAFAYPIGVAETDRRKLVIDVDLHEREIGRRIVSDDLRLRRSAAVSVLVRAVVNLNLGCTFDDVVVREDVSVGRDDEAGATADLALLVITLIVAAAI